LKQAKQVFFRYLCIILFQEAAKPEESHVYEIFKWFKTEPPVEKNNTWKTDRLGIRKKE